MAEMNIKDGHHDMEGIGSAVAVNSSKTKNFIKSVSRRPVDASGLPSVGEFYADINAQMIVVIVIAVVLFLVIVALFLRRIPEVIRNTPTKCLARTMTLCGIYPIIGAAALVSVLIPKAILYCDTICHVGFTICAYQFFCLCIDYAGGESNFIKQVAGEQAFNVQTPPICCCLKFLPSSNLTKQKITVLRMMVLQMPIIQTLLLSALNIMFIEDEAFYSKAIIFLAPFLILSVLTGVWSLQITTRMIAPYYVEYKLMGKYFAVQLILIFCKLQPAIVQGVIVVLIRTMDFLVTNQAVENTIVQLLILFEMVLLSLFAQHIYQTPSKRNPVEDYRQGI